MSSTLPDLKYTDVNGLQSKLKEELRNLRKKEYLSYWPRFLIRRISLYAIPFLMFFAFFFCLSLTKKVGMEKVNIILGAQNVPARDYLLLVVGILAAVLFAQWWYFNRECILSAENNVFEIPKERYKLVAHIVLIIFLFFCFCIFIILNIRFFMDLSPISL